MSLKIGRSLFSPTPLGTSSRVSWLYATIYLIVLGAVFIFMQSASEYLVGNDGYFHIKYSQLLGREGFIDKLPWLQYTIHRDEFRDHHLLWHYLLIPFSYGDLITGGQVAIVLFFLCVGFTLYVVLTKSGVRWPALWSIAALFSSHTFLFRMSLLRVQSLSLALLLLMFILCERRKYLVVYVLSIFFVWLYDGYPLLLLCSIIFCISSWLIEKNADYKIVGVCVLGIVSAIIVNPYFPDNIHSTIYNASRSIFLDTPDVQLGREWEPYKISMLLANSVPVFILLFASICTAVFVKKISKDELAALLLNLCFLLLTLKFRRFIEYWSVFAMLSAALLLGRRVTSKYVLIGFLLISPFLTYNITTAFKSIAVSSDPLIYKEASQWLKKHSEPGENVFNGDWDDFPLLFFYNSSNNYIVGLDPMYLYSFSKEKFLLYNAISRGDVDLPAVKIVNEFNSRFVFLEKKGNSKFQKKLDADPLAKNVFEDEGSYVYKIEGLKDLGI